MNQLTRMDTSALNKTLLGFDDIFSGFENRFAHQLANNYPPYNVIKYNDDCYEVEIAVAGFSREELDISVENNQLSITGNKDTEPAGAEYLHRGLAARNFSRTFTLGQYLEVDHAEIKNGLLVIALKRNVPEALKPRTIAIK